MQFFQDFDPAEETNPEKEISMTEKGVIMTLALLVKLISRKARKAKTYGDLYKMTGLIKEKVDGLEEKYGDEDEATPDVIISEINDLTQEVDRV